MTNFDMRNLPEMHKRAVDRARRTAARVGWRVEKARGYPHQNNRGGLMLLDERNRAVAGLEFDLTPAQVIEICRKIEAHHDLRQVRARLLANGYHTFQRGRDKFWLIRDAELTAAELRDLSRVLLDVAPVEQIEKSQPTIVRRRSRLAQQS